MSDLNVQLDCGDRGRLLAVEVIDVASGNRFTESLPDGISTPVQVEPGQYLVQAVAPDGALFSGLADVTEGAASSVLLSGPAGSSEQVAPAEPAEQVAPAADDDPGYVGGGAGYVDYGGHAGYGGHAEDGGGAYAQQQAEPEGGDDPGYVGGGAGYVDYGGHAGYGGGAYVQQQAEPAGGDDPAPTSHPDLWACVWSYDGQWQPQPWPDTEIDWDGSGATFELRLPSQVLHALLVGGPDVASTVVVLPPASRVIVSVRPDLATNDVALSARTYNDGAESLLAYLTSGQLAAATALAGRVLDEAQDLLYSKISDPLGAVVGGLFLLRTRSLERLHDWPTNLADWNAWLPDAAVVRAEQLLTLPEVPRDELRRRLLQAVNAGVPVYAISLGWLYEALRLLANESPDDHAVHAALDYVRPYAKASDWSLALTTFCGTSPAEPTLEPIRLTARPTACRLL